MTDQPEQQQDEQEQTTEWTMQDFVREVFSDASYSGEETEAGASISSVSSYDDVGMMTMNKGVVVTMSDGTEFQVSIVQSR
jgi:hypothetical protein